MQVIDIIRKLNALNVMLQLDGERLKLLGKTNQLTPFLVQKIRENKQELMEYLKVGSSASIPRCAERTSYPLTPAQKRIWILSQFEGGSEAYHITAAYQLEGNVDIQKLQLAYDELLQRHQILQTSFQKTSNGTVEQFIQNIKNTKHRLESLDLQNVEAQETAVNQEVKTFYTAAFDLTKAPLTKCLLIQVAPKSFQLHVVLHHIISDGWSMEIFVGELILIYNNLLKNKQTTLNESPIQYTDYSVWLAENLEEEELKKQRKFWLSQFKGEIPVLALPTDYTRPSVKTYNGKTKYHTYSKAFLSKLQQFTASRNATLFMGLMTGLNALLYRYTGQTKIVIGTPVSGRDHQELEQIMGLFLNILAIPAQIKEGDNLEELLERQQQKIVESFENQQYPFDQLVTELSPRKDPSRSALFDVLLVLQNQQNIAISQGKVVEGLEIESLETISKTSQFDLSFSFAETSKGLQLQLTFNSDLFKEETIKRMIVHFENLLVAAMDNLQKPINELNYLAEEEQIALAKFNDTKRDFFRELTIVEAFEQQLIKKANQEALVFGENRYSFNDLARLSNQLGNYLTLTHSIEQEDRIGIELERSEWLVIAVLTVLKLGAVYVPIDPHYPEKRKNFIKTDSQCALIIDEKLLNKFLANQSNISSSPIKRKIAPHQLAYMLYTSGTTGNPKGVLIEHSSIINRIDWMWRELGIEETDVVLQKTTFTFDVSVWELLMPLGWGCKMVVCDRATVYSPTTMAQLIEKEAVTILHFVPSMLQVFNRIVLDKPEKRAQLATLKLVITSGEALRLKTVQHWYRYLSAPIYNLYGPTEATIDVSYYKTGPTDVRIPIGKPVQNTQLYILDQAFQKVPIGITGELYIGGCQLARGYWNRPQLTKERFLTAPFLEGKRLYHTGDLARWLPDGNIDYIGRNDHQVKIRGQRIELAEIEQAILKTNELECQTVVMIQEIKKEPTIVAYIVASTTVDFNQLKQKLLLELPGYMVPSFLMQVDEMPLTANGKVDRKALPPFSEKDMPKKPFQPPENKIESNLALCWQMALNQSKISTLDNFFELGGNSLKVIQVLETIREKYQYNVRATDFYRYPTIGSMAKYISQNLGEYSPENVAKVIDIKF